MKYILMDKQKKLALFGVEGNGNHLREILIYPYEQKKAEMQYVEFDWYDQAKEMQDFCKRAFHKEMLIFEWNGSNTGRIMKDNTPRAVLNKDIPILSRVMYIMQDVCSAERRAEWEGERLFNTTARIDGMLGGGEKRGVDTYLAALEEKEGEHREEVRNYLQELKRAERVLNAIPYRSMRTFVTMLYVDNIPAVIIQKELNMTRRSFERARKMIENARSMKDVKWPENYFLIN